MFNNSALWWLCSLVVANMHTRNFMGAKKTFLLFFLSCSLTRTHFASYKGIVQVQYNKRKRYKLMKRVSQGKLSRVAVALDAHHHQQTLNIISLKSTLYSHHRKQRSTNRRVIHGPLTSVVQVTPIWDVLKSWIFMSNSPTLSFHFSSHNVEGSWILLSDEGWKKWEKKEVECERLLLLFSPEQ